MILHFSHIGLTEGRTFMIPFGVVPDGVALVAVPATATMPPERRHFAHRGLAGPSATKQNTKRFRRDIRPLRAVSWIALFACCSAVSEASAAPPILVHAAAERHPATSVPGTPPRPEVYERRAGGW